jgi:hypothetical protein
MSSNRGNASAIQRRSVNQSQPQPQQPQQTQQQRPNTGNQRTPQRNQPPPQQQQQQQFKPTPKLSVSDAMALVSLRLGRVETFINAMPTLDQLHQSNTSDQEQNYDSNTRIVDEAVFTSIVSRLDKVEKNPTTSSLDNTLMDDKFNSINSEIVKVNSVSLLLDSVKTEVELTKTLLSDFQNNIQLINKRLDTLNEIQSQQQILFQQIQDQLQETSQDNEDDEDESGKHINNEIVTPELKDMITNNTISVDL